MILITIFIILYFYSHLLRLSLSLCLHYPGNETASIIVPVHTNRNGCLSDRPLPSSVSTFNIWGRRQKGRSDAISQSRWKLLIKSSLFIIFINFRVVINFPPLITVHKSDSQTLCAALSFYLSCKSTVICILWTESGPSAPFQILASNSRFRFHFVPFFPSLATMTTKLALSSNRYECDHQTHPWMTMTDAHLRSCRRINEA